MKLEEAMGWFRREIRFLELAPTTNNCEMLPEWKEQIQVFTVALACCEIVKAIRGVEPVGAETA